MTSPSDGAVVDLNRVLEELPRLTVDVGHRRVPVFRSLGVIGFQVAVVVVVLGSLRTGVPLATALGVCAVAGASFFVWGLLRRAVTRRERLVLIEYVWVGVGSVAGFLVAAGQPLAAGLDLMAVALCPFLAAGRVGCALVGCCHGVPAGVGLVYGRAHGLPARLTGVRLLPVQLLEAAGLVAIGLAGFALLGGTPGRATVWFLAAYAVLRFGCEALRGDRRPVVLRMPVPRLMCVVQAGFAVALAEVWLVPGPPGRSLVAAGAALGAVTVAGAALTALRGADPLVDPRHLDETWDLVRSLSRQAGPVEPLVAVTSRGMRVAVTVAGEVVHASLSHAEHPTAPVAVGLHLGELLERRGVTHLTFPLPRPADSGAGGYFGRRPAAPELAGVR